MIIVPSNTSSKVITYKTTITVGSGYLWGTAIVGNTLYCGDNSNNGKLYMVNTGTDTVSGSITLTGIVSTRQVTAIGNTIYTVGPYSTVDYSNWGGLSVVDATTNTQTNVVNYLPWYSGSMAVDDSGQTVIVGSATSTASATYPYSMRAARYYGTYSSGSGAWWTTGPAANTSIGSMAVVSATASLVTFYVNLGTGGIGVYTLTSPNTAGYVTTIDNPAGTVSASFNYFHPASLIAVSSTKAYVGAGGNKIYVLNTSTNTIASSIDLSALGYNSAQDGYNTYVIKSLSRCFFVMSFYSQDWNTFLGTYVIDINTSNDVVNGIYKVPNFTTSRSTGRSIAVTADAKKLYLPQYDATGTIHVYELP